MTGSLSVAVETREASRYLSAALYDVCPMAVGTRAKSAKQSHVLGP